MKKYILIFASFLGFLPNVRYLYQAWSHSRLDSFDWIFYLIGLGAIIWGMKDNRPGKLDFSALVTAFISLLLIVGKNYYHVNALSVLGSIGFAWSISCFVGGWAFGYRLLPGFCILVLGTPSSSYYMAKLFMISASVCIIFKFVLAVIICGGVYLNQRYKFLPRKGSCFFVGLSVFTLILILHAKELYFSADSFIVKFKLQVGEFIGRSIIPDANTKRFFATSEVKQYRYFGENSEIAVLAVRCGRNVHEIHPASHCLRTSRWEILSEKIFFVNDKLAVTEIEAVKNSTHILVWVWYSSEEFSTPAFLGFRRRFRVNGVGNYYTYQISVPIIESADASRKVLQNFISTLKQEVE